MSISDLHRAEIRRLFFGEHWRVGTIANHLGPHHDTVRRVVGVDVSTAPGRPQPSALDPYIDFMRETLAEYPGLTGSRLTDMLRVRGYKGSAVRVRRRIRRDGLRPRPRSEAFFIRSLPRRHLHGRAHRPAHTSR